MHNAILALLVVTVVAMQAIALYACFSRSATYAIWDTEDSISEWYDSFIATYDETSDDETSDNDGIDNDIETALLEYGLDPARFYIDPAQPNTLQRKW